MITSYGIQETTRLGITKEIVNLWIQRAEKVLKLDQDRQAEILSSFLLGNGELVVELGDPSQN